MQYRALSFLATLPLLSAACDSGSEDSGNDDTVADTGGASLACVNEMRDDFAIGMTREGALFEVTIVDAMPADPIRGDNVWMLSVSDGSGGIEGVALSVRPWMPDHGHGTPVEVTITDVGGGEYSLEPLNLFMAGLWEIRLDLRLADGTTGEVMFAVCVE